MRTVQLWLFLKIHAFRRKKVEADPLFVNYLQQSGIRIVEPTLEDLFGATRVLHNLSFGMMQLPLTEVLE
jgi:hypothetical protein